MREKARSSSFVKRLLAIFAALAMVLTMGVGSAIPAMADDTTYSITVHNTNNHVSINGKTYYAYKVFDLTLGDPVTDSEGKVTGYGAYAYSIKNTDWAWNTLTSGSTTDENTGVIGTKYGITLTPSSQSGEYIVQGHEGTVDMSDQNARDLANALKNSLPSNADGSAEASDETATINLTGPGYYAVFGTADASDKRTNATDLTAAVGLTTADPTKEVEPKVDAPTLDKKITGVSEGSTTVAGAVLDTNGKSAAAKIGSTVSYELDSVVPDLTGYSSYTYTIHDTLTAGLDYVMTTGENAVPDVSVSIAGQAKTAGTDYTVALDSTDTTNRTMTVTIPYDTLKAATKGAAIVVTYSAKVNSAALTTHYEKNTAYLEYSNNPYDSTTTDKTPDKETFVVDINIDVKKIANNNQNTTLSGAKFKLYRGDSQTGNVWYKYDTSTNTVTWVSQEQADEFETGNNGALKQVIRGLDQGTYHLLETEAPEGYNRLTNAISFTISATYSSGTVTYSVPGATMANNVITLSGDRDTAEDASDHAKATITVNNQSGSILPSTGGIGTTIFYVIGGVLVAGAVILLVSRRRRA